MQYTKDIVIGDMKITIQHYMPTKGIKVLTRLTKLLGKPLAEMAGGADKEITEVLPIAVASLVERMDENDVEHLIKELVGSCFLNGQPIKDSLFETAFQGRIGDVFKLCIEVVNFQFSDFLSGLLARKNALVATKNPVQNVQSI